MSRSHILPLQLVLSREKFDSSISIASNVRHCAP